MKHNIFILLLLVILSSCTNSDSKSSSVGNSKPEDKAKTEEAVKVIEKEIQEIKSTLNSNEIEKITSEEIVLLKEELGEEAANLKDWVVE